MNVVELNVVLESEISFSMGSDALNMPAKYRLTISMWRFSGKRHVVLMF